MGRKKVEKSVLNIRIGSTTEVVYAQVRPETKEWLTQQQKLAGAKSLGQYLDVLCQRLKEM